MTSNPPNIFITLNIPPSVQLLQQIVFYLYSYYDKSSSICNYYIKFSSIYIVIRSNLPPSLIITSNLPSSISMFPDLEGHIGLTEGALSLQIEGHVLTN